MMADNTNDFRSEQIDDLENITETLKGCCTTIWKIH